MRNEPFARVLGKLAARRATGMLVVQAGEARRDLYLKNGSVVQAVSRLTEEALGSLLVSMGLLSTQERDAFLEQAASQGRLLGDLLIERGAMTPMEVVDALTEQVRRRVLNCLRPEEFQVRFAEGTKPPSAFQVDLPIPPLLLARVTEAVSLERMALHLGLAASSRLRLTVGLTEALLGMEAGPKHMRLIRSFADGPVADLARSEEEYEILLGLAYTLWALGRLEVVRGEVGAQSSEPQQPAIEVEPQEHSPPAAPKPTVQASHPSASAPPRPVVEPERSAGPAEHVAKSSAQPIPRPTIREASEGASEMQRRRLLRDLQRTDRQQTRPGQRAGRTMDPAEAVVDAWLRAERQDYFSLLGLKRDASPSDVKIAFGGMLRRYRLESPPDDWPKEAKDAAAGLLAKASLAFALLTDPKERSNYREHLQKGAGEFEPANPMILAAVSLRAADRLRARGRYADAVEELRAAAADFPKQSEIHFSLGRIITEWIGHGGPGVENEAASALATAARLDPALDGPWYYLGLLARKKGDEENARKMFGRALAVNPRNELAKKELSELESHTGLFGKLFGK